MRDFSRYVRADRFVMMKPDNARDILKRDDFATSLAERFSDSKVLKSIWKTFVNTTVMDDFILSLFSNQAPLLYRSCAFDLEIFQQTKFQSSMSMFRELRHGMFERCTWLWRLQLGSRVLVQRRLGILESASNELVKLLRWSDSLSCVGNFTRVMIRFLWPGGTNYPLREFKSIVDDNATLLCRWDCVCTGFEVGRRIHS